MVDPNEKSRQREVRPQLRCNSPAPHVVVTPSEGHSHDGTAQHGYWRTEGLKTPQIKLHLCALQFSSQHKAQIKGAKEPITTRLHLSPTSPMALLHFAYNNTSMAVLLIPFYQIKQPTHVLCCNTAGLYCSMINTAQEHLNLPTLWNQNSLAYSNPCRHWKQPFPC